MGDNPTGRTALSPLNLGGIPFHRLFEVWREDTRSSTEDVRNSLQAWNEVFGSVVAQVAKRVQLGLGNEDLANSAARSAFRTFLHHVPKNPSLVDKLNQVDGPDALVGYLVVIAYTKARERLEPLKREVQVSVLQKGGFEFIAPERHTDEDIARAAATEEAIQTEMRAQLTRIFERLGLLLGDERRPILYALYLKKYQQSLKPEELAAELKEIGLRKLTYEQIAARYGITARTLYNLNKVVEGQWPRLVREAVSAIDALEDQLRDCDED